VFEAATYGPVLVIDCSVPTFIVGALVFRGGCGDSSIASPINCVKIFGIRACKMVENAWLL
jgi:hypothetical protein